MENVSILIALYNAESYIKQAILSILCQSYQNFKVIIYNDGSTDGSLELLKSLQSIDNRIIIHHGEENKGIAFTRDYLMKQVDTDYFAWMDADDISMPNRLSEQIYFLENNPDFAAVSGGFIRMHNSETYVPLTDPRVTRTQLLMYNVIVNPTAMVRTAAARESNFSFVGAGIKSATDYAFWLALVCVGKIKNLESPLILYRTHETQESIANKSNQNNSAKELITRNFEKFNVMEARHYIDDIYLFSGECPTLKNPYKIGNIYKKLIANTATNSNYDQNFLIDELQKLYMRYCKFFGVQGFIAYIKVFGLRSLLKRKKFGLDFLNRCVTFERK